MSSPDDFAFKLPFQLGENPVTWHFEERSSHVDLPGMLSLKNGYWPSGEMFGAVPAKQDAPMTWYFPQLKEFLTLRGTILRGGEIELLNGGIHMMSTERATISATAAVISKRRFQSDNARLYRSVRVQIEDLNLLSTEKPIGEMTLPQKGPISISATANEDARIAWETDDASVVYGYDASLKSLDFNGITLVFSPSITISIDHGISATEWYLSWVVPLKELLSIAAGRPLDVNYLLANETTFEITSEGDQVFGWGIKQTSLNVQRTVPNPDKAPIRIITRDYSFLDLLVTMKQLKDSGHPLIQTYSTLATTHEQHPRARVLLSLQALEGAYGFRAKAKLKRLEEKHQEKRNYILTLLDSIAESDPVDGQLSRQDLRFIKKYFTKRPLIGLAEALEFYFNDIPEMIWQGFRKFSAIEDELKSGEDGSTISQIAGALTAIRNALSHGRKSYKNEELDQIASILDRIVRYEFLQIVGLNKEIAEQIFEFQ